jgi:hypothetical protein
MSPDFSTLVDLPSYYIDKYEVTNQEYDRFLRETGYKPPHYWVNGNIPDGKEHHPVVSLGYRDVEEYARWAGKRIPTELEWEKAARGIGVSITKTRKDTFIFELQTQRFPFGEKYDSKIHPSIFLIGDSIVWCVNPYLYQDRLCIKLENVSGLMVWSFGAGSWSSWSEIAFIKRFQNIVCKPPKLTKNYWIVCKPP